MIKERYFLVVYIATSKLGNSTVTGNGWFKFNGFPSNSWIKSEVIPDDVNIANVVVTNIFEFKNKTDFESFSKS